MRDQYHAQLRLLMPELPLPSAVEEQADPNAADQTYEACVARLREHTRSRERFPLVFEENVNYGYRRNVWAMRPVGIVCAVVGLTATLFRVGVVSGAGVETTALGAAVAFSLLNAALLWLWVFHFSADWVRTAAKGYARQLLAACQNLRNDKSAAQ